MILPVVQATEYVADENDDSRIQYRIDDANSEPYHDHCACSRILAPFTKDDFHSQLLSIPQKNGRSTFWSTSLIVLRLGLLAPELLARGGVLHLGIVVEDREGAVVTSPDRAPIAIQPHAVITAAVAGPLKAPASLFRGDRKSTRLNSSH